LILQRPTKRIQFHKTNDSLYSLTDDEIRRNYEEYGHPDGKQELSVGIALPKGMIALANGYYALLGYGLLFGIFLPAVVGRWWYGSRRLTKEGVEVETAGRYFKAVKESSSIDNVVGILASSREFESVLDHFSCAKSQHIEKSDILSNMNTVGLEKKIAQAGLPVPPAVKPNGLPESYVWLGIKITDN
jgi:translocation protein SEC63